jgi:hypothetical protein
MATNKTIETQREVHDFVNTFVLNQQKITDSFRLIELMTQWSGSEPKMWGPSIIGFGKYHYKYSSGHQGDSPLIGFSPRKAAFSLYVTVPGNANEHLLKQLGKFKAAKACIYVSKLSDINLEVLRQLCLETIKQLKSQYTEDS